MPKVTKAVLAEIERREKELMEFYTQAKEKVSSPVCIKVFETLLSGHQRHLERLEEIRAHAAQGKSWLVDRWMWDVGLGIPNPLTKISEIVKEHPLCSAEEIKWLDTAMEKEEAYFHYLDNQAASALQSLTKRFYMSLAYEGRGYYLLLLDTKDCVAHPDLWQHPLEGVLVDGI